MNIIGGANPVINTPTGRIINVIVHHEDDTHWAESPDIHGWCVVADTAENLDELIRRSLRFNFGSGASWVRWDDA